jgi:hypothetical protein
MAWAIVARRALSPSTPRAQGAPLRASGVDRSARPSKWLSCQQCEEAPLGLPRSIFNRHPPEVSITEICYQFRVNVLEFGRVTVRLIATANGRIARHVPL